MKRIYPEADVAATDLSEAAIASVGKWVPIFRAAPDRTTISRAYETPFEDNSFQLIFAYAAAHHFRRYRRTMAELSRILAPGGVALFFHESSCPELVYKPAFAWVNKKQPVFAEDLLVRSRLTSLAKEHNLKISINLAPTLTNRVGFSVVYFYFLNKMKFLANFLPCSADVVIQKPLD